ncbi:MAG: phosphate ABC transporter ATP-binding protein [Planctomycetota bacterium]|nr:phosphate ABC transporter ATP-binding protein [Planctomycetota bacterium]
MTLSTSPRPDAAAARAERPSAPAVFDVRGLDVRYGAHHALKGVSCEIHEGEVTAILGPSGCGKTTFLKSLNRTLELAAAVVVCGRVLYRGADLYGASVDPRSVRKTIGIIHQRPVVFPLSIRENVLFGTRFHGLLRGEKPDQIVERYLTQVGLWAEVKDRLGVPAHRLSGGQQQRLCLARTLANEPAVLLMDEPCASLDPAATQVIEDHILRLREAYPIAIVTHNLAQASRISSRVLFMMDGQLVESGRTRDVFNHPQTVLARDFLSGRVG